MMRQVLNPELVRPNAISKRQTGGLGVGAAAIGVASLFWREAGSQAADGAVSKTSGLLSPARDEQLEGAIVEPLLFASQVFTEQVIPSPMGTIPVVPSLEPTQISSAGSAIAYTPLPISAVPLVAGKPVPATMMVANLQEVAQASAGGTATDADGGGSYWPEGHWADDRSGGGFLGTALGVGGGLGFTALLAAGGWYTWQYIYGKPSFDHSIVYLKFDEGLCGDPVYTAPGKGRELTYSIIENPLDDSSLVEIDADTGEITFIDDPQYDSPGDLDRDRIYHFVVEIEDGNGNTATQVVELEIQEPSVSDPFVQDSNFLQHGASTCADDVEITELAKGQSIEDISTGQGNDYVEIQTVNSVEMVGIELGSGGDTLKVAAGANSPTSISVDVGIGRDTIILETDVLSLEIESFDQDDLLNLMTYGYNPSYNGSNNFYLSGYEELTLVAPVLKDGSTKRTDTEFKNSTALEIAKATPGQTVQLYSSEADALAAVYQTPAAPPDDAIIRFAFYQNGEDTFMVIETDELSNVADRTPETTIKFEDLVLTDYSNIVFA